LILAISQGIDNLKSTVTPLQILQQKLERSEIVREQKKEFSTIYMKCLAQDNFTYEITEGSITTKYQLITDLIMVTFDYPKILLPTKLIGPLLAYMHLQGHRGVNKMMMSLNSYYFKNMYSLVRSFTQSCYCCFLNYRGKRKQKVGVFPMPSRPFEEVLLDLAENINPINGYSHLLVAQCAFSDFLVVVPLKSKGAQEVTRAILNSLLMNFNVDKLHSDNGSCFRSGVWLETMHALGIKVLGSAALHPAGRGKIEIAVGTVKLLLKKM
jgi:hypothetical protein